MEQHLDHEPFNQSVMETLVGDDTVCTDVSSVQVNKTCEEYTTYDKPELKNLTYSGILVGGILFLVVSIKAVF